MSDPRVKKVKRLLKGFNWGNYGLDLVEMADSDDWAKELAEEIVGKLDKPVTVDIQRPEDRERTIVVLVNGKQVAEANYDEHGWSGMDAVEAAAVAVARACGATLTGSTPGETA